jgi:hypothetical protein
VKAHSNNTLNDRADILAKKGRFCEHYTNINQKALDIPLTFTWDTSNANIPLDHDIRKISKTIITYKSFEEFLKLKPLKKIKINSFQQHIDWQWTKIWFYNNAFD